MHRIEVEPLTPAAFAEFGDVITTAGAAHFPINDGTTERYHDLAEVQFFGDGARPVVSVFRGQPFVPPVEARVMERHPLGSQAFMPLNGRPYIVAVAPVGDAIDPASIRAFLAEGDQGVNYHAGVWHLPLIALEAVSDFLVIDREGPGDNCETFTLSDPVALELPSSI